jgi:sugar phosphate isomerase/epimerase
MKDQGYGVEFFRNWRGERDLFDPGQRIGIPEAVRDMPVSLHTCGPKTLEDHCVQVDAARELGAKVLVLHPSNLSIANTEDPDIPLARDVVAYAVEKGVRVALENGYLSFQAEMIEHVEHLEACLDVGHVYFDEKASMRDFLETLRDRITHLHIQDTVPPAEKDLPDTGLDHFMLGTGGIPPSDWELLARTLEEIDYTGIAVVEIRPRNPWQTAFRAREFMGNLTGVGK